MTTKQLRNDLKIALWVCFIFWIIIVSPGDYNSVASFIMASIVVILAGIITVLNALE